MENGEETNADREHSTGEHLEQRGGKFFVKENRRAGHAYYALASNVNTMIFDLL